jgi:N-dimethylarginine dimethylaminohydrolase
VRGGTGLDSIYTHDPALVTEAGAIILQLGKPARRGEGPALAEALRQWEVPILGVVDGMAMAEAGDLMWLDRRTLVAGRSFRTNTAGIAAVRWAVEPLGVRVMEVHLPGWEGPGRVLHLMSLISLLDEDLAVVYRKLLPVPLLECLADRGVRLVDVPDDEFGTQGCNVLALGRREAVMVKGNPQTRRRLEAAGCKVAEFEGGEIALKGSGGPTCLTRPLWRSA